MKIVTKYIFLKDGLEEAELINSYPNFYQHLQNYKQDLEKRYQYNRKINYWEWVFLRNFGLFNSRTERIFVPCKERISNKNHFRLPIDLQKPILFTKYTFHDYIYRMALSNRLKHISEYLVAIYFLIS